MSEALSGPERMMQMAMKMMGIDPKVLIDKFQAPIEQGLAGIKDVDMRLTSLENNVNRILAILEKVHDCEETAPPVRDASEAGNVLRIAG